VCWNDKGGKAERQTGGRAGRKEGIKEKRGFSRAARLRGSKITPAGSTLLRARTPGTAYKKERERRKHLESGIITRLIIYADHYFDGADRPPSITFVPPLVLPAILLSFRDPALPQIPPTHPLSSIPLPSRPLFYYPKTLRKCHGQDRYHKFAAARKNHRKTSRSRLGREYFELLINCKSA